jgi:hypothetical protein
MSWWFEPLLLSTRLARADGALLEPLEPVLVRRELRIGHRGAGLDFEWELGRTLVITPTDRGLRFRWDDAKRERVYAAGEVWSEDGVSGPCLRVLSNERASCAWPTEVAAPMGPWSDELLAVLGDSLLEKGYLVGARLASRVSSEDSLWLPLLPLLPPPCREVTWRRGVVDVLRLRTSLELGTDFELSVEQGTAEMHARLPTLTWPLGRALASHALCKPMRVLELEGTLPLRHDLLRVIAGLIAGGGLPCLERITCRLITVPGTAKALRAFEEELRTLPGVAGGLPTLNRLEVVAA